MNKFQLHRRAVLFCLGNEKSKLLQGTKFTQDIHGGLSQGFDWAIFNPAGKLKKEIS